MFPITHYGDPVLRKTAAPVESFDDDLAAFIEEMTETMIEEDGVGLAAPQVGVSRQIAVIDTTMGTEPPLVLINPEIVKQSEEEEESEEGCLSIPGISLPVKRSATVSVTAAAPDGTRYSIEDARGLLARALQHEIDHLRGILFIDHVSPIQRALIKGKLKKITAGSRA